MLKAQPEINTLLIDTIIDPFGYKSNNSGNHIFLDFKEGLEMKFSTQTYIHIDSTIGRLIALVIDCVARVLNAIRRTPTDIPEKPACILISKFMGIGSIVQAFPLFVGLRKQYPEARILLLTFKNNEGFTQLISIIDKVYFIDKTTVLKLAVTTWKSIIQIKKEKPIISIDLEVYSRFSRIITFLIFAPYRLGFFLINTIAKKGMFTHLLYFNRFQHISSVYRNMALLTNVTDKYLHDTIQHSNIIKLPVAGEQEAAAVIKNLGIKDKVIILVNINASDLCIERRWPTEYFQSVIRELLGKKDVVVILIGSLPEREYNQKCLDQISDIRDGRIHNIAGKTSFSCLLALLKKCNLFLTNDSGPMHLASLMNCPTVSLWGPGTPQSYAPKNANHTVIYHSVYCSPCLYMLDECPCRGDNKCMQSITTKEVYKTCLEMLGEGIV